MQKPQRASGWRDEGNIENVHSCAPEIISLSPLIISVMKLSSSLPNQDSFGVSLSVEVSFRFFKGSSRFYHLRVPINNIEVIFTTFPSCHLTFK
uniref:Uncharacterized protein n=1 Tax=Megaselia scalaris TaxID=36166 RepID=T1H5G2_MEGSC